MRIRINDTTKFRDLDIPLHMVGEDEHTNSAGLEAILDRWADRPSRVWSAAEESDLYVVAKADTQGGIDLHWIEAPDEDLYSLTSISRAIDGLQWGNAIGEPDALVQQRIEEAFEAKFGEIPQSRAELLSFIFRVVGDAL